MFQIYPCLYLCKISSIFYKKGKTVIVERYVLLCPFHNGTQHKIGFVCQEGKACEIDLLLTLDKEIGLSSFGGALFSKISFINIYSWNMLKYPGL